GGFYPLLAEALARRHAAGLPGLTLLSCDNLAENGRQLETLLGEYLAARSSALAGWFAAECTCPATMVDRIVPATTPADLDTLEQRLGLRDEGAVFTERFSQWVIEHRFAGPRPAWEKLGAELVSNVAPYETAKLRMLNGAHSALAHLGLERGHEFVHQAIADPALRPLIERLMRQEAGTSFTAAPGQDIGAYADALLARFADPALNHRLIQIAMDGSQKIPQRWLETLAFHQAEGRHCPAILEALAAWLRHVRGEVRPVDDPMAGEFRALWQSEGRCGIASARFGPQGRLARYWQADHPALEELKAKLAEKPEASTVWPSGSRSRTSRPCVSFPYQTTSPSAAAVGNRIAPDTSPRAGTSAITARTCAISPPALLHAATVPVVLPRMRSGKLSAV